MGQAMGIAPLMLDYKEDKQEHVTISALMKIIETYVDDKSKRNLPRAPMTSPTLAISLPLILALNMA